MSQEGKDNFQVLNFNKMQLPQFVERVNEQKGWIDFGVDNQFPRYLQSLVAKSPLHSSIVTQKARMIGGYGFLTSNLEIKTMLFLKNIKADYDFDELLYRCAYDLEIYGAFALNPIWSKDRQSLSMVEYVDVSKLRIQAPDKEDMYPQLENYFVSDGWENTRKYEPKLYPGFSTKSKKKASQILYIKEQRAGQEYYGIPEYISAIRWMEIDWLIGDFHMNNIRNGFAPSYVVTIPILGASAEERAVIAARVKADLEGTTNAGQWYINFTDNLEDAPSFTPIEMNNSDGRFMLLEEQSEKSILNSHRVSNPLLFGIPTPGSLGSKNEILEALELFQNAYITPKQNLLSKVFNRLARINGITDNLVINKYSEQFIKVDTNISDILSILTAELEPVQKYEMLVHNGYTHQVAAKLTGYTEGNNQKHIPKKEAQPAPSLNGLPKNN